MLSFEQQAAEYALEIEELIKKAETIVGVLQYRAEKPGEEVLRFIYPEEESRAPHGSKFDPENTPTGVVRTANISPNVYVIPKNSVRQMGNRRRRNDIKRIFQS